MRRNYRFISDSGGVSDHMVMFAHGHIHHRTQRLSVARMVYNLVMIALLQCIAIGMAQSHSASILWVAAH